MDKELKIGTKIEMEHTTSKAVARKIAMDHLKEHPQYYTKGLLPMERRLGINDSKTKCKNKEINWIPKGANLQWN